MEPTTKIWLVTLNEGHSMVETAFSGIWNETLLATISHTSDRGQHYALLQCNDEPDLLAVILGNCSIDPSLLAQNTGDKSGSGLLDFITHKELFHLDTDVEELPLADKIAILFSDSEPAGSDSLPGKGKWAVPTSWSRINDGDTDKKTWIQIASSEDVDRLSQVGAVKNFSKILESHVASQTA